MLLFTTSERTFTSPAWPASGSLGGLKELWLNYNQIGNEGMKAFSTAIASGALPKLAEVFVGRNPGNGMGVKEACSARGIECC